MLELLVVIGIVGILAALIVPAVSKAKGSATSAACKSNLRQLALGIRMYVDDFGRYPLRQQPGSVDVADAPAIPWNEMVRVYVEGSTNVFMCPHWTKVFGRGLLYQYNGRGGKSYGAETFGLGEFGSELAAVPEGAVRAPADMIAIGDTCGGWLDAAGFGWPGCNGFSQYRPHAGQFNAVFCDGHVESSKWKADAIMELDERTARRWFRDNAPHRELWPAVSQPPP